MELRTHISCAALLRRLARIFLSGICESSSYNHGEYHGRFSIHLMCLSVRILVEKSGRLP